MTDYKKLLKVAGYHFETGVERKLLRNDGKAIGMMSKEEFEKLGDLVAGYIQQEMKEKYGMKEVWIGGGESGKGPKCNIFISNDFYTNKGRCLILIQGMGAVRAG